VPIGAPARHQADAPSTPQVPGRGRPPRYLWGGLLLVPVLIVGGLYLTRGPGAPARSPGTAAASSGPETAAASPAVASAASASPGLGAVTSPGPAACGLPCAGTPFHVGLARVPAHARARRPGARPASSVPSGRSLSPSGGHATSQPAASGSASTRPSSSASQQGTPADHVLALINQARASAGLPPLTVTAGLDASASAHNLRMADGCGLTHVCPGEPAIGARETAAGVNWTAAGENIGEGGPMPDTTAAMAQMAVTLTQDMLNEQPPDDGHRLNILSSTFTHIGIAVDRNRSGTVWMTQDFSN
jgi:uncharacterized protein YkwD